MLHPLACRVNAQPLASSEAPAGTCFQQIISIWLRHFRVRVEFFVLGRATLPLRPTDEQIDLDRFSDSINGSRRMANVPQLKRREPFTRRRSPLRLCASALKSIPPSANRHVRDKIRRQLHLLHDAGLLIDVDHDLRRLPKFHNRDWALTMLQTGLRQ